MLSFAKHHPSFFISLHITNIRTIGKAAERKIVSEFECDSLTALPSRKEVSKIPRLTHELCLLTWVWKRDIELQNLYGHWFIRTRLIYKF